MSLKSIFIHFIQEIYFTQIAKLSSREIFSLEAEAVAARKRGVGKKNRRNRRRSSSAPPFLEINRAEKFLFKRKSRAGGKR